MGRLDNNPNLLNALHNNTPFVYAHLVKFEKPIDASLLAKDIAPNAQISYRNAPTDYIYMTDGAFDVVFDDGQLDFLGLSNGPQTYIANKVLNIGNVSDSAELKLTSTSITLDASTIDASLSDSITTNLVGTGIEFVAANKSFVDAGLLDLKMKEKLFLAYYRVLQIKQLQMQKAAVVHLQL